MTDNNGHLHHTVFFDLSIVWLSWPSDHTFESLAYSFQTWIIIDKNPGKGENKGLVPSSILCKRRLNQNNSLRCSSSLISCYINLYSPVFQSNKLFAFEKILSLWKIENPIDSVFEFTGGSTFTFKGTWKVKKQDKKKPGRKKFYNLTSSCILFLDIQSKDRERKKERWWLM